MAGVGIIGEIILGDFFDSKNLALPHLNPNSPAYGLDRVKISI